MLHIAGVPILLHYCYLWSKIGTAAYCRYLPYTSATLTGSQTSPCKAVACDGRCMWSRVKTCGVCEVVCSLVVHVKSCGLCVQAEPRLSMHMLNTLLGWWWTDPITSLPATLLFLSFRLPPTPLQAPLYLYIKMAVMRRNVAEVCRIDDINSNALSCYSSSAGLFGWVFCPSRVGVPS